MSTRWPSRAWLAALSVVSLVPPIPFPTSSAPTPAYFTAQDGARSLPSNTVALVLPYIDDGSDAVPMLWQAQANFHLALVDGLAIHPDATGHARFFRSLGRLSNALSQIQTSGLTPVETQATRETMQAELRRNGVELIVIGPMRNREVAVRFITWLEGTMPRDVEGAKWSGGRPSPSYYTDSRKKRAPGA